MVRAFFLRGGGWEVREFRESGKLLKFLNHPKFPKVSAISMPSLFEFKEKFISFVV